MGKFFDRNIDGKGRRARFITGLILLVAMVGAIVLTLRHRVDVRRQSISAQLARTRAQSVDVVKVPVGSGSG